MCVFIDPCMYLYSIYTYIYIYISIFIFTYIYIYRAGYRKRGVQHKGGVFAMVFASNVCLQRAALQAFSPGPGARDIEIYIYIYTYIHTYGYPPQRLPLENAHHLTKAHTVSHERVELFVGGELCLCKGPHSRPPAPVLQSASQPDGQLQYCSPPKPRQVGRNLANKYMVFLVRETSNALKYSLVFFESKF